MRIMRRCSFREFEISLRINWLEDGCRVLEDFLAIVYDDGLKDKFEKMDYFGLLRQKIYPNDPFFKAPEPPPLPKFTQ